MMRYYLKLATLMAAFGLIVAGGMEAIEANQGRANGRDIVGIARGYIGVPYQFGGTTPQGFDCSGLVGYVYNRAGMRIPRNTRQQYASLNPVRVPQPGDLVFFRTSGSSISHVGIYVGDYRFIHAPSSGREVSYADIRQSYWKTRYAGARSMLRPTEAH